jgi:hypothetical protein
MITIRLLAVTVCLTLFSAVYAQSDSIKPTCNLNAQMFEHLTKALLNSDLMMGVFERPDLRNSKNKHLKTGIIPEMEKDYLNNMLSSNLIKLTTQKIIKGDFDSIIFIKFPSFATSGPYKSNPVFQSGSVWVLLLEKAYNKDESAKMSWVGKLENKRLFNETTLFLEAFETYYALCLKWPANVAKSSAMMMVDEKMVNDLVSISKILEIQKKEKKIELLKLMIEKDECLSTCGKLLVDKILSRIN